MSPAAWVPRATSRDAAIGREQAKQYCYNIQKQLGGEVPFCFYTNGHDLYFWDLENAPPRKVIGFANRCIQCIEIERNLERDLRATAMAKLKAEAERKVRRELKELIDAAHKEADDILKAAMKEAMNKAKMLEKAKATRAANRAAQEAKALAVATVEPEKPTGGSMGALAGPSREVSDNGPEASASGDDGAPWD